MAARPFLTGFITKPKKGSASQAIDLLEKSYLSQTKHGEFTNEAEIDGYLASLKKLNQADPKVQSAILDMENKKLQFQTASENIVNGKGIYETTVRQAATKAIQNNFNNPKDALGSLAAIYTDAADNYDEVVTSQIFNNSGKSTPVPEEVLKYRETLHSKAKTYADLFNSYNFRDKSGKAGVLNPDGFAVVMTTNPTNGKIVDMDFVPSDQVPDGYVRTDTPLSMGQGANKLPTYLKAYDLGVTDTGTKIKGARVGDFTYAGTTDATKKGDPKNLSVGKLTVQKPNSENLLTRIERFFLPMSMENKYLGASPERNYDQFKKNGFNLADGFQFDAGDLPGNSLVQVGAKTYYQSDDGKLMEVAGANADEKSNNLKTYLQGIGKQPVGQFYADKNYLISPDGKSKVSGAIDKNVFNPEAKQVNQPISFATPQASPSPTISAPDQGFFAAKNRASKPKTAAESSGGRGLVGDIIAKGKSFFSGLLG